jgi:hypothetical protein
MRVRNKKDNREGRAERPPQGTVLPPLDKGHIMNGTDWAVYYDDGEVRVYSHDALPLVFDEVME